ncbi:MAG TPA: transposase [Phenylobacterium sp.]|nr:transposase [Phenylobacterium sp.]
MASLPTSYLARVVMRDGVVLGVERRRRWADEAKLAILAEVGVNGWTVADVARRHDLTRQHIYQWRREMRRKGLWPETDAPSFLPVEIAPPSAEAVTEPSGTATEITVVLRNGRQLRCPGGIGDEALTRLVRLLESA